MTDLYYRTGILPAPLPAYIHDEDGNAFSAPFARAIIEDAGFLLAPPKPGDTETQIAVWTGDSWVMEDRPLVPQPEPDPYAHYVPVPLLRQRLEKLGLFDDFSAYLAQFPTLMFKVLSLERGVDPAYPDLITAFDAMSVPQATRDYLMADPAVGVPDA